MRWHFLGGARLRDTVSGCFQDCFFSLGLAMMISRCNMFPYPTLLKTLKHFDYQISHFCCGLHLEKHYFQHAADKLWILSSCNKFSLADHFWKFKHDATSLLHCVVAPISLFSIEFNLADHFWKFDVPFSSCVTLKCSGKENVFAFKQLWFPLYIDGALKMTHMMSTNLCSDTWTAELDKIVQINSREVKAKADA